MSWAVTYFCCTIQIQAKKIRWKKIRVPTECILSVETIPTECILSVGTVPMGCILIQIQRFMLYQDSIHPPSFSVFYLPITLGNKIKKRCPEYFTWFRYIRDHRCLNEKPEVQKFKSVSGNLMIGPKTFCKKWDLKKIGVLRKRTLVLFYVHKITYFLKIKVSWYCINLNFLGHYD